MKQLNKYNRVAGYLNKLYDMVNADFFDSELERPIITIQSTPRAYGHYTLFDAWSDKSGEGYKEINIGAGTLDRPIEYVISTLIHEMCHQYNNQVLKVQDYSRGGTYHNKRFKESAEAHGLMVERSEKYGWSTTSPSDALLDWILMNGITDIEISRNDPNGIRIGTGSHTSSGGIQPKGRSNSRRYVCPSCGAIVRATREVNIICGDCMTRMIQG